jgi:small-conductance mechanosensitive channel
MSELGALAGRGFWAAAIAIGFPLALVLTTELAFELERRGHPLERSVRWIRNYLLPLVALVLFLRRVVELPPDAVWVRMTETACWVATVIASLGVINRLVFDTARRGSWQARVPRLLRDLVGLLLAAVAAALVYQFVWGQQIQGALAALGVTSIVVGLALQEPLGNLFSGLMLLMERPFEVGDTIEVGGVSGVVKEVNWRSAHIESGAGLAQVVPNSTLNKETISNYSRPTAIRMQMIDVNFSYDDPPNKVCAVLLELAASTRGVLAKPKPIAATLGYGDFAVNYRLIFRTTEENRWSVRNAILTRLWYAARRHGLTMPYPVSVSLQYLQTAPFERARPSAGEGIAQFPRIPVLPDVMAEPSAERMAFGRNETIFGEGEAIEGVYLVVNGAVSLQVARAGQGADPETEIAVVRAGEFFGLAGIYGRHPAESRAVAIEDTDVVKLGPETVRMLFEASPHLARETGHALDVRRKAVQSVRTTMRERPGARPS